ncbi:MAG: PAS domain S-box protein [Dehalococcoidia bacterium]|jgi:PAS domain S-box-containing protein|nr:PAS domain S-box protein [Dehalococcoidia bacterium]
MTNQTLALDDAALLEQSPDAVIYADADGAIRVWNAGAVRIFGHEAEAAIGQSLDLIIPEDFRERHWAGWERAAADGVTQYVGQSLPTRAMHANGEPFMVELSFAVALDADGNAAGAIATARDISERWDTDRANRRKLRDLEEQVALLREQSDEEE